MIYDKRKGSLLNYIQLPLHVITSSGTFLGTGYDAKDKPTYILSHLRVDMNDVKDLTFSSVGKKITKGMADFILEKQLRNIGNILERFIKVKISQPHYDALLYHFFIEGVSTIENSSIVKLINAKDWYSVTDEIQSSIMKNGKVDDKLAQQKMKIAKMFSYVPGFS